FPPVLETVAGRIGVAICYDVFFPEVPRGLALAGADIIAVPTNWTLYGDPPGPLPIDVVTAMAAAYTMRVYMAGADRCGDERGVRWVGGASIVSCGGELLAGPAGGAAPALLAGDCDLALSREKQWGERNDVLGDRRPALYRVDA